MIIRIVRIILAVIIFCNDRVRSKINKQSRILPNYPHDHLSQMVVRDDLSNNQICADMQTSASAASFFFKRKQFSGKAIFP